LAVSNLIKVYLTLLLLLLKEKKQGSELVERAASVFCL